VNMPLISALMSLVVFGPLVAMKVLERTHKFEVGQCITSLGQEEWDHLPIYKVLKIGKSHYLVGDCESNLEMSVPFQADSQFYVAVTCPKGCHEPVRF